MKRFILPLFTLVALMGTSCAQDISKSEVPSVVLNAFQQRFEQAKKIEWERKGEVYEVEFDMGLTEFEAWLDHSGQFLRIKEELFGKDLPEGIKSKIASEFVNFRIDDVDKIDEKGKITYKVELDSATEQDRKVTFDEAGEILENNVDW
ncbi:PepSY-like domain-containing protein [Rapidithrix thailandica]|uniref:PepSY-like domain-containing protein n=1 Tax=Rapidithrix thailandica TaxID=413964 RepID=A0AAW9SC02_9BACT